jgi:F-type H+-transporting ATPase subunit delta
MQASAAARRYAKALFEISREDHKVAEVRGELARLSETLEENRDLRDALFTPLHPADERKKVLDAVAASLGLSQTVKHFQSHLIDRRRLVDFPEICEEFGRLADETSGLMTAEVTSASPLDDRRKDRLRRALSQATGREVRLEVKVDSELIGGAIAKVGDVVFDGTLSAQLSQLRANLTKGS